jgi:hypothetical protein
MPNRCYQPSAGTHDWPIPGRAQPAIWAAQALFDYSPICADIGGSGRRGETGEDEGESLVEAIWVFHHDEVAYIVDDRQFDVVGFE